MGMPVAEKIQEKFEHAAGVFSIKARVGGGDEINCTIEFQGQIVYLSCTYQCMINYPLSIKNWYQQVHKYSMRMERQWM